MMIQSLMLMTAQQKKMKEYENSLTMLSDAQLAEEWDRVVKKLKKKSEGSKAIYGTPKFYRATSWSGFYWWN